MYGRQLGDLSRYDGSAWHWTLDGASYGKFDMPRSCRKLIRVRRKVSNGTDEKQKSAADIIEAPVRNAPVKKVTDYVSTNSSRHHARRVSHVA